MHTDLNMLFKLYNFRIELLVTQSKLQKEFNEKMTEQMSNLERQLIVCSLALEQIAHKIDTIGQFYSVFIGFLPIISHW